MSNESRSRLNALPQPSRRTVLQMGAIGLGGLVLGTGMQKAIAQGMGDAEITIGKVGDPNSFDGYEYGNENYVHQQHLYDHLVDYDYDLKVLPKGLTSWEIAPDNMSAKLVLRPDITLHSGRNWTAEDLIAGFARAASGPDGLQLHGPMEPMASWTKAGDHEVLLDFKAPISEAILTDMLVTFPVTDASLNGIEQVRTKPSGSGPYRLISREPNDNFVLERFENYWQPGVPPIKTITVRVFDNEDIMISALLSGAIQGADFFPGRAYERLGDRFGVHEGYEGALGRILRHNVQTGPFVSQELRQAFFRCIDRDRIAKEVYYGFASPTFLPWVHTSVAHDPSYDERFSFNLDAARDLIVASGETSASVMVASNDKPGISEAQIIQADLAKIGFDLQVDPTDSGAVGDRYYTLDFDTFLSNIGNIGKRSPSAITTNSFMRTNTNNALWGEHIMPEYIEAMSEIRTAPNAEVERRASNSVNEIMAEKAWFATYVHLKSLFAHDLDLEGAYRDTDDRLDLNHATFKG